MRIDILYGLLAFVGGILTMFSSVNNDMYLLALEKNETLPAGYSIHGLWPQYTNGSYPQYCRKVSFDKDKIENLVPKLDKFWASNEGSNDDFWKHEWQKHGSCMFIQMTEEEYFSKTLNLYQDAINKNIINNNCFGENECYLKLNKNFDFYQL